MRRIGAAIVAAAAVALALVLVLADGSSTPTVPSAATAPPQEPAAVADRRTRAHGRADCSMRSEADFPGAFTSPDNLVVGPLVLMGGAYTDASTVREYGGDKFPVLVKAGSIVTVRVVRSGAAVAGLAYGPMPQGETRLRDSYRSVTFVSCRPGTPSGRYSPDGPSGSYADGHPVTFWSGFVLTSKPACIALEVYEHGQPAPQRVGVPLGARCDR